MVRKAIEILLLGVISYIRDAEEFLTRLAISAWGISTTMTSTYSRWVNVSSLKFAAHIQR